MQPSSAQMVFLLSSTSGRGRHVIVCVVLLCLMRSMRKQNLQSVTPPVCLAECDSASLILNCACSQCRTPELLSRQFLEGPAGSHPAALLTALWGVSRWQAVKALFWRERCACCCQQH